MFCFLWGNFFRKKSVDAKDVVFTLVLTVVVAALRYAMSGSFAIIALRWFSSAATDQSVRARAIPIACSLSLVFTVALSLAFRGTPTQPGGTTAPPPSSVSHSPTFWAVAMLVFLLAEAVAVLVVLDRGEDGAYSAKSGDASFKTYLLLVVAPVVWLVIFFFIGFGSEAYFGK